MLTLLSTYIHISYGPLYSRHRDSSPICIVHTAVIYMTYLPEWQSLTLSLTVYDMWDSASP